MVRTGGENALGNEKKLGTEKPGKGTRNYPHPRAESIGRRWGGEGAGGEGDTCRPFGSAGAPNWPACRDTGGAFGAPTVPNL